MVEDPLQADEALLVLALANLPRLLPHAENLAQSADHREFS